MLGVVANAFNLMIFYFYCTFWFGLNGRIAVCWKRRRNYLILGFITWLFRVDGLSLIWFEGKNGIWL